MAVLLDAEELLSEVPAIVGAGGAARFLPSAPVGALLRCWKKEAMPLLLGASSVMLTTGTGASVGGAGFAGDGAAGALLFPNNPWPLALAVLASSSASSIFSAILSA